MISRQCLVAILAVLCIIAAGGFFVFKLHESEFSPPSSDNVQDRVSPPATATTPPLIKQPCRSEEDWHQKADQTGAWIEGLLVDQALSDTEIMSILASHNISAADDIRISSSHYIGYYIEVLESQYQQVQQRINFNETNISFSSPMYGFTYPAIRNQNNFVLAPVLISYSPHMNETMTYQDLVDRGIPVRTSKIVELYGLQSRLSPANREQLLIELSRNDRVFFTFKEYMEGVLCEYPP